MNYLNGESLKKLREQKGLTQRQLAETIFVSDKTISKWETGRGLPDVTVLPELAAALSVSVAELLAGEAVSNRNRAANMQKVCFYVCPVCGNVLVSLGESVISCCGISLPRVEPEEADSDHFLHKEYVDGELLVQVEHPMEKTHFLSFFALCGWDGIQLCKLYPEQDAIAHFRCAGHGKLYAYCNRHGLFCVKL